MNHKQLRSIYIAITGPLTFLRFFKDAIAVSQAESYFPELKRKPKVKRAWENLAWLAKYHEVNDFYNLYGFDIENNRNQGEYIDNYSFCLTRNDANKIDSPVSQTCILRDKLLFYEFMQFNGFPVPKVFAVIENGNVYDLKHNVLGDSFLKDKKDYFIKDRGGECASFVKHIKDYDNYLSIKSGLPRFCIIQETLKQSNQMNKLNPLAINTIRVCTVNKDGSPYVLSALLRVGTKNTGNVDNWAAGGLAVGIESDGRLKEFGMYKPCYGGKTDIHPDSGIKFGEFVVPQYKEAISICLAAHACLRGIHSIGWDIALTENGPYFIEGNDNWEISLMQSCDRPLINEWRSKL